MTCYDFLCSLSARHPQGMQKGIYSVCTTHPLVLDAALLRVRRGERIIIETTANQVNQFGGYTGMTAKDFLGRVRARALQLDAPLDHVVFGSDHAGPFPWRTEPASMAMEKARGLVAESVLAGYSKIHLDASMHLADDPGDRSLPLDPRIGAQRTAELCKVAEDSWTCLRSQGKDTPAPLYVIGTDVPAPGGTESGAADPKVTLPDELERTVEVCREAFQAQGLEEAWDRVIAVVVQPAVEHGESNVHRYTRDKVRSLVEARRTMCARIVFEAHATDYQTAKALREMVQDDFSILKVGPSLTGAVREALFLMDHIEEALVALHPGFSLSKVAETLEKAMLANPSHWRSYYQGDEAKVSFLRKYGLSDRCRYYWGAPSVNAAIERMMNNLRSMDIPMALMNQYFPRQSSRIQEASLDPDPESIIRAQINEVLEKYGAAVS